MAAVASSGAQVTRATALKMPPKNEANVAISSALRDCPLAVSFGPSSRVAAAATVPGVPTRMARDRSPVNGPGVHAEQHGKSLHGRHPEGKRDEQGYAHRRRQARHGPEQDAQRTPVTLAISEPKLKAASIPAKTSDIVSSYGNMI